jgi:glycerophosphoryl diester phosphodiesterase
VTSFALDRLEKIKSYAPNLRIGYLTSDVSDETVAKLVDMGAGELCPKATDVTAERVSAWHRLGFNVRAWGVSNEELMRTVYDAGVDGMTVNFPDKLLEYIAWDD